MKHESYRALRNIEDKFGDAHNELLQFIKDLKEPKLNEKLLEIKDLLFKAHVLMEGVVNKN